MIRQPLQQVSQTVQPNDRQGAYRLCASLLREHPSYVPGWLWMSTLVGDLSKERECLERALVLDPTCVLARERLEIIRLQEFLTSVAKKDEQSSTSRFPNLGVYLMEHRFVSQQQLDVALKEQRRIFHEEGRRVLFGEVLVQLGFIMPQVLASVLLLQQRDKLRVLNGEPPHHIGEYLVVEGAITPEQLAEVLVEQTLMRQMGQNVLVGELLLQRGYVQPEVLKELLDRQHQVFHSRFGD